MYIDFTVSLSDFHSGDRYNFRNAVYDRLNEPLSRSSSRLEYLGISYLMDYVYNGSLTYRAFQLFDDIVFEVFDEDGRPADCDPELSTITLDSEQLACVQRLVFHLLLNNYRDE